MRKDKVVVQIPFHLPMFIIRQAQLHLNQAIQRQRRALQRARLAIRQYTETLIQRLHHRLVVSMVRLNLVKL